MIQAGNFIPVLIFFLTLFPFFLKRFFITGSVDRPLISFQLIIIPVLLPGGTIISPFPNPRELRHFAFVK